jgi:hypothetical protein
MRRLIAILFLTVYFNVAWGSAFNLHFCCGHLSDITFANFNHHNSDGGKTKNALPDCCKEKSLQAKTDNHKTSGNIVLIENNLKYILPLYSGGEENNFYYNLHPGASTWFYDFRSCFRNKKFLVYCNLRI